MSNTEMWGQKDLFWVVNKMEICANQLTIPAIIPPKTPAGPIDAKPDM
jgi:hypothetical protein